jgi:hypothetical protein
LVGTRFTPDIAAEELSGQCLGHERPCLILLVNNAGGVQDVGVEEGEGGVAAHVLEQLVHKHLQHGGLFVI